MYTAQDVLLYHWISLLDTQQAALAWKREESGWAVAITSGLLILQLLRKNEQFFTRSITHNILWKIVE